MPHPPWRCWRWLRAGGALILALLAFSGCGPQPTLPPDQQALSPTVAPLFQPNTPPQPPITTRVRATPVPPTPSGLSDTAAAPRPGDDLRRVPIFDNALAADWSLEQSDGLRYNLQNRASVHSQPFAIDVFPLRGAARLFFTVSREARQIYAHDQILGISMMINGGPNGIGYDDLLFTVVGSNAYTYWRANDTSVRASGRITDQGTIFDEQRLYFLGFEQGIPPNIWAEVTIWLDDRILDAEYDYLTGFYILTDERFVNSFYIDDVNLLLPRN